MIDPSNSSFSAPDVDVHLASDRLSIDPKQVENLARFVLKAEGKGHLGLSLAFVDDVAMAEMNEAYLGHKGPTDVISFPLLDDHDSDWILGEVVVSLDTAARQAPENDREALWEALLYVVHGTLHLLGYDDHDPEKRRLMHMRQEQLLNDFLGQGDS
jgi:probable rRNA maturation factor